MDWEQFGIMLVTFVGLFICNRSEARSDTRMMLAMIDAIQKEIKKGLDKQTDRTDKLYEMFTDLIKESKR